MYFAVGRSSWCLRTWGRWPPAPRWRGRGSWPWGTSASRTSVRTATVSPETGPPPSTLSAREGHWYVGYCQGDVVKNGWKWGWGLLEDRILSLFLEWIFLSICPVLIMNLNCNAHYLTWCHVIFWIPRQFEILTVTLLTPENNFGNIHGRWTNFQFTVICRMCPQEFL